VHDLALFHKDQLIRQLFSFLGVVGDHEDGDLLLDFGDGLPEEHLLGLVEAARGVVQDQALGVPDERHSEGEPALAVDGLESDLDVLVLEQADRVEGLLDVLLAV
jgi:hypothetical protein